MTQWFWWEHFFYAIVNTAILVGVIRVWRHVSRDVRGARHERRRRSGGATA